MNETNNIQHFILHIHVTLHNNYYAIKLFVYSIGGDNDLTRGILSPNTPVHIVINQIYFVQKHPYNIHTYIDKDKERRND